MQIPEFLYKKLLEQYGEEYTDKILKGYTKTRATTIRINNLKSNKQRIKEKLQIAGIKFEEIEWYNEALIIQNAKEEDIQKLDIYQNGEIYMQNLSSMIPPIIVEPKEKEGILDMAAAPGGKTTQMASISNNLAMITACEKNKIRAERLKYNLDKQGANRVTVMLEDARKLNNFFSFDKILLDAPCSGSGTIKVNNENLEKYFTKELVERSVKTQKELLIKASKIVKEGGEIIYSTCSILKEENEEILKEIISKTNLEIVEIDKNKFENVQTLPAIIPGTICVCPNELYEGFFVAKLRRVTVNAHK